jgi:hypothetical protein
MIDITFPVGKKSGKKSQSIQELLQSTTELIETFSPPIQSQNNYSVPTRTFWAFEVLGEIKPEDSKWLVHHWSPISMVSFSILAEGLGPHVFHGHPVGEHCFAKYYCHVLGYKPTGTEHPSFIKNFNEKWKYLEV